MNLETIKNQVPDYAKDLKLNLGSVLTPQGVPGLTEAQLWLTAVASAIACGNASLTAAVETAAAGKLDAAQLAGARAAAAIMGMNNVYYRFTHLVEDEEYSRLPARLRMNVMANPGIDKVDFELASLAVSAIRGCGKCIVAHERVVRQAGLGREAVQSAVRIAATLAGVAGVLDYEAGRQPVEGHSEAA
ncbi:MAG: carboxymuconolactone decarboxylase family protein [Steroidobacteraceae bacterium]|jgi:alkyl hydroperoxide reductase subunit D